MADDDVPEYDIDDMDSGMLEWLYVEDDYPLADELAESQIAEPGYAGTNYEIDMEHDEFDLYNYWDDLQYGDDEYWDHAGTAMEDTKAKAGQKRKRDLSSMRKPGAKREKLSLKETDGGEVRFVPLPARIQMSNKQPPMLKSKKSFALLPDWRQRFADDSTLMFSKSMPEEMKKAAESKDEDPVRLDGADEDGDWEDEDGEGDLQADLASLDPEMLKAILKQKLGDAGLEGMDEGAFMQTIAKMLSGDSHDAQDGDVTADLANSLLGQASEGKDSALSGWLSQQGVSLDAAEDDDEEDASSVATAELPEEATSLKHTRRNTQVSPPDSAIELSRGVGAGAGAATTELAFHGSSPSTRKRSAPTKGADEQREAKKRKKVSFDVPPSSSNAQLDGEEQDGGDPSVSAPGPERAEKDTNASTNAEAVHQNESATAAVTNTVKSKSKSARRALANLDAKPVNDVTTEPAPAKGTRKRKAQADEDEVSRQKMRVEPVRSVKAASFRR